jgi:hypothetical protein
VSRQPVKTFFPQTRLAELAARPGGVLRSDAIESAQKNIESLRGEADATLLKSIAAVQKIAYGMKRGELSEEEMHSILKLADQIVTLAGTFGYSALDRVVRSLCDLTDGLLRAGLRDAAPILVHVQSIQLIAPGSPQRSPEDIEKIHAELAKVIAHYRFESLARPGVAEDGEIVLAAR